MFVSRGMGEAFPFKVNITVCSLAQFEETLVDKLTPGIEELRADLVIEDTTLGDLGTKVPLVLGQAFDMQQACLLPRTLKRNHLCT